MIHTVHLPEFTKRVLSDVLWLQFRLLCYAYSKAPFSREACSDWLRKGLGDANRASQIAEWIWNSKKRFEPLEGFSKSDPVKAKNWVAGCQRTSEVIFNKPEGFFSPVPQDEPWQKNGSVFLRHFYEDLRSKSGLPGFLTRDPDIVRFTAQDLLSHFMDENNGRLYVCPACDEIAFYIISNDQFRTDIDHYFPKEFYPHLSIHPYNLVPTCTYCNSRVKLRKDPLKKLGGRARLEDIFLPYRDTGLSKTTFLDIKIEGQPQIGQIKPLPPNDVSGAIVVLSHLYDLPKRWDNRVDFIGETLFKRINEYTRASFVDPSYVKEDTVNALLEELLSILYDEDIGREPFAYAMTWWLAKLMSDENNMKDVLIEEIVESHRKGHQGLIDLRTRGKEICALLPES